MTPLPDQGEKITGFEAYPKRCMERAGNRVVRRHWLHQLEVGVSEDSLVGLSWKEPGGF